MNVALHWGNSLLFLENPNDGVQVPPAPCSLACALGSSGLHLQKVQLEIQGYRKGQQLSILGKDSNWLCSVFLEQGSHCEGRRGPQEQESFLRQSVSWPQTAAEMQSECGRSKDPCQDRRRVEILADWVTVFVLGQLSGGTEAVARRGG